MILEPRTNDRLLRLAEVAELFRVHPRTVRNWVEAKQFPEPVRINTRGPRPRLGWYRSQVDKFRAELLAEADERTRAAQSIAQS